MAVVDVAWRHKASEREPSERETEAKFARLLDELEHHLDRLDRIAERSQEDSDD